MGQFVVIGLDNFGNNLARSLSKRRHEVLALDSNEERVQNISDDVTKAIVVNLSSEKQLEKLIKSSIDAAIVSIGNVAVSVLTVMRLKELGVENIVAKALSNVHAQILALVGATETIMPERDAADIVAMRLTTKNLVEQIPLAEDYNITELAVPDKLIGKTIAEAGIKDKFNIEIIAVKNVLLNEFSLMPKPDFIMQADSVLIAIGKNEDISKIEI